MKLADDWSVRAWTCLRGAGFAADRVAALASRALADALDRLIEVEDAAHAERTRACDALARAQRSKVVNRAIKALERGELPSGVDDIVDLPALTVAEDARRGALAAAEQALAAANRQIAERLHAVAEDPAFREALIWQNRVAAHGSVAGLLRRPLDATDSKTREQRRLVASYLQRYCVKNDTIGFFGPVGWATFDDSAEPIALEAGPLLAAREVYFEYWAIDAFATQLAGDPALRADACPRRMPSVWLDGNVLHHPNGKRFDLAPEVARLLAALDGTRSARLLARELGDDVFDLLAELADKKLCTWTFEIPPATFRPELDLRRQLAAADPTPARDRALATLDELEGARIAIARAAGDPVALDAALHVLDTLFEERVGTSATRSGGETYAGRTLVFEDCRRDVKLALGRLVLGRVGPALALVLDSARWYSHAIAARYQVALRGVFEELAREHGDVVPYLRFHERAVPLFSGEIVGEIVRELHARWAQLLGLDEPALAMHAVARRTADLAGDTFRAPGPGWPSARHHAPDLMIAAASVEAIRRGDYTIVLGELHAGLDTTMPCLLKEHPDPEVIVRAREQELPAPGVAPVWSKARNRADFYSVARHDLDVERGETRSARPRDQVLATGELVVERAGDSLVVRTRDRRHAFDVIRFYEHHLIAESYARFGLVAPHPHVPRITIDDVVVQRESWTVESASVAFAAEPSELARIAGARRWVARHGIPRCVFVKTDTEAKPFFVDFESPIFVEIFARNLARSKRARISEMLPALDQCWLVDASGNRYTSELRVIAIDQLHASGD